MMYYKAIKTDRIDEIFWAFFCAFGWFLDSFWAGKYQLFLATLSVNTQYINDNVM